MVRTRASHASSQQSVSSEASGISSINTPDTGFDGGSHRGDVDPVNTKEKKDGQKQGEALRGTNNSPSKKDKDAGSNDAS